MLRPGLRTGREKPAKNRCGNQTSQRTDEGFVVAKAAKKSSAKKAAPKAAASKKKGVEQIAKGKEESDAESASEEIDCKKGRIE